MEEFVAALQQRLRDVTAALRDAQEADDDYLVTVRAGELDSLRRLALDHGVVACA